MGHVHADLTITWEAKEATIKRLLVDTGATFTVLPKDVLENIGAPKSARKFSLELGNGEKVEAEVYALWARIDDREGPAIALTFEGAKSVIGVQTLESLGLRVNPTTGELEFTRPKGVAYFY